MVGHAPSSGKSNIAIQSMSRTLRAKPNTPIMIYDIESYDFDINSFYPFTMRRISNLTRMRRDRDDKTPWWKRITG